MKKLFTLATLLLVALIAPAAFADTGSTAGSVASSILVGILTNPDVAVLVASLVVGGVVALARTIWKDKAEERLHSVGYVINLAYYAVNDMSLRTENKVDNKVAEALRIFRDQLALKGYVPTDREVAQAKAAWTAMHGAELTATKVQGAALTATLGAIGSTAALAPVVAAVPQTPRGAQ
ncbi:hypothetical protein LXT21_44140 [Myxococcus sp. K38C18041901]|uniref:hypothetical protein n=1 Tax=Myxococcus guangdongensis TaxID=2906760 RepID=UPI0020A767F5|nr:hypothetical protein [Myxococcus guangdongensis]MCP3065780.1 hypothetical protein [Myxococcus guangdongensis]